MGELDRVRPSLEFFRGVADSPAYARLCPRHAPSPAASADGVRRNSSRQRRAYSSMARSRASLASAIRPALRATSATAADWSVNGHVQGGGFVAGGVLLLEGQDRLGDTGRPPPSYPPPSAAAARPCTRRSNHPGIVTLPGYMSASSSRTRTDSRDGRDARLRPSRFLERQAQASVAQCGRSSDVHPGYLVGVKGFNPFRVASGGLDVAQAAHNATPERRRPWRACRTPVPGTDPSGLCRRRHRPEGLPVPGRPTRRPDCPSG